MWAIQSKKNFPLFSALKKPTFPPFSSTSFLETTKPRPVLLEELSTGLTICSNLLNNNFVYLFWYSKTGVGYLNFYFILKIKQL